MNGRPLRSTRTYTLGPYATLFRSLPLRLWGPEALLRPPGRREGIGVPPPSASGRVAGVGLVLEAKHRGQGNRRAAVGERQPRTGSEHTSELKSLMRISYAVFCLKKNKEYARQLPSLYICLRM